MATFPIDYDAIRIALVTAVATATGLPESQVIMLQGEQPDAPRPDAPYVGIMITTASVKLGEDFVSDVTLPDGRPDFDTLLYSGDREMVVGFDFYGQTHEQAYGLAGLWQSALDWPPIQAIFNAQNFSHLREGAVEDLSILLNTEYEGRAHVDVTFGLMANATVNVGSFTQLGVDGALTDGVHTENVTFTPPQGA